LTQNAGHTIEGLGQINAGLTNAGIVNANNAGNTLEIRGATNVNTGTMEATAGGVLDFDNAAAVNNAGGQITASGGTVDFQNGAAITGGTLTAISPSVMNVSGNNGSSGFAAIFNGVTIAAGTLINVPDGNTLDFTGSTITDNGTILINSNNQGAVSIGKFSANTLLTGSGRSN